MAALSPAQENALSLWLAIVLAALLAFALVAVITSPPQTDSPPAEAGDAGPYLPKHASEPPAPALPRRIAGQSGVAYTGDPVMCRPWTLLGLPAANIPAYRRQDGLPVGVQLVSLAGHDLRFLADLASAETAIAQKEE